MKRLLRQTYELARVRTVLFWREPEAVFWVFVFPILLAAVLGFAFRSSGASESRVAVLAGENAQALADKLAAFEGLEVEDVDSEEEARIALRNGKIDVLVEPADPPVMILDLRRPESETARLRVLRALEGPPPVEVARLEEVTERGGRYIDFLFPGLLGMNLMGTGMWAIGFGVADMRQRKALKRLLVTPMSRPAFLSSFLFSRLAFLLVEITVLVLFGMYLLGVPFRGGLVPFVLLSFAGALTFAGVGLLCASRVKTIEGASGMLNFVMMPMWLGSGIFFSYERFPDVVHPFLRLLPLTALNDALREVLLDGRGLAHTFPELCVLVGWGVLSFLAALWIFRWE